jgi:ribosomal protein S18 acetylase RimI-like enzyme
MVVLRAMTVDDIPAALELWSGMPGICLREADNPVSLARYLDRNPGTSYVAVAEPGLLVGVSLAGHDGRRGYLHHVAVLKRFQGQGIGKQLVIACLDALMREGIEKVHLWVRTDNASGRSFWSRLGWSERSDIALMSIVTGDNPNA